MSLRPRIRTLRRRLPSWIGLCLVGFGMQGVFAFSPFGVSASVEQVDGGVGVRVEVDVPEKHYVYADEFRVRLEDGAQMTMFEATSPSVVFDKYSEEDKEVYDRNFAVVYLVPEPRGSATVVVELQGCDESVCFFPETHRFDVRFSTDDPGRAPPAVSGRGLDDARPAEAGEYWQPLADRFILSARDTGFLRREAFLDFLGRGLMGESAQEDALAARLRTLGMTMAVLLILLGGAGLNLTPCVLPLIPINLAIIGAGAKAGSKSRGFLLGAAYGAGMAFVYGVLGVAAVLTGSTFGALNASPWFNMTIATLFVFLALAMFDVITIDFTRFQGRAGSAGGGGSFLTVSGMGAIAALLAGACVAPVVISVLLLAGTLYSQGNAGALLLPFLLGVGMALPWPFAGAGMTLLPKPGRWMNGVKYAFGAMILIVAFYYGHVAYGQFRARLAATQLDFIEEADGTPTRFADSGENSRLAALLREALRDGKPVFIDFWATWCKNCIAMERSTFQEPDVMAALREFVVVKYQAERPGEPAVKEVLDYFDVLGLPSYVVLVPESMRRKESAAVSDEPSELRR